MSITWEETRILESYHGLPRDQAAEVMRVMRSAGVRRENAFKSIRLQSTPPHPPSFFNSTYLNLTYTDIGVDKYAFNQFQLMLIPEIYRAPKGTEGARTT